jgi:hypothetical protein
LREKDNYRLNLFFYEYRFNCGNTCNTGIALAQPCRDPRRDRADSANILPLSARIMRPILRSLESQPGHSKQTGKRAFSSGFLPAAPPAGGPFSSGLEWRQGEH